MRMDLGYNSFAVSCALVLILWGCRVLNWVWFRPKKIEKCLRKQGLKGKSYRVLYGDSKESAIMVKEANSKPINIFDDIVPRVMPFLRKTINVYGKASFIWFGWTPRVLIMDTDLIKEVFTKIHSFQKQKTSPLVKLFINGLAIYEGEVWEKHRKIINPAFHQEKLKHMLPAFYLSCSEMVNKWEKLVSTKGSCEFDVWPYIETFTSDVISRTSFGSSYEEGKMIFEHQKELAELVGQASQSVYIPGWRYLPTKNNKRMRKLAQEIKFLIRSIIDNKIKTMKHGEGRNEDLLGILLESNFKEIQPHENKIDALSISEVIEECKQFYFAGQATTSLLLVWTMFLLSIHPDWQERAREEVMQVFGNEKPDFEGLNRLKIVSMILHEVLRLYPPSVIILRNVENETILGEISLPPGVQVMIPTMLLHRDQEIWGDDAKEFNPERFSEGVSKATKGRIAFFPFGWGSRICIGLNFAMLEAKMAMAMILQRFSFELSSTYVHAPHTSVLLEPQYGVQLILHTLN
ncbi:hypothetical protein LguiA_022275 [Lonicera macranthoides]